MNSLKHIILACLLGVVLSGAQTQKEYDFRIAGIYTIHFIDDKNYREEKEKYAGNIRMKLETGMYKDWITPKGYSVITLYSSRPDIDAPLLPESFDLGMKEEDVDNVAFGVRLLASYTFFQGTRQGLAFGGVPPKGSQNAGWRYAYLLTYKNNKTGKYTRTVKILVQ